MTDTDKPRLTKDFIKKLLRSNHQQYYTTPSLNDILYLHYKGFNQIENLEEFTELKVLYFEGNGLTEISGLESLKTLRTLYLQENLIKKIGGLDELKELKILNIQDNLISTVENLKSLENLQTLLLKRNKIGTNGLDDVKGLLELPGLQVLDIQDNQIQDEKVLEEVFMKLPNLGVLYCQNNPFCKKIPSYRKTIISKIPQLRYLDDRPVFPDERRFAEAWAKGGLEAEREERAKYKKEEEDKHLQNHLAFKNMMDNYRRQHEEQKSAAEQSQSQPQQPQVVPEPLNISIDSERSHEAPTNESSLATSKLSTYNSENPDTPDSHKRMNFSDIKSDDVSKVGTDTDSKRNSKANSEVDSESDNEEKNKRKAFHNTLDELE